MDLITTPAQVGYTPAATAIVHSTTASLTSRAPVQPVHLVQYDQTMPVIAVSLTSNYQPYTVPSGAAVNVRMDKRDGHYVYNQALGVSEDRQTAYIGVTLQMTTGAGEFWPTIEIVIDGQVAGTSYVPLLIAENPVPEDAIESTDEYKTIQQLAAEVTQAAKAVTDNLPAINDIGENIDNITAVAQNGENISEVGESIANVNTVAENLTPIQTAADNIAVIQQAPALASAAADSATLSESWAVGGTGTREGENTNNAKYYAEQAQQVSQGAVGWYETERALQAAHPTGQNGQWAIIGTTDTIWTWDSDTSAWVNTGSQIDLSNYYQKQEADARFQMPIGFYFDWAPVSGGPDLSTAQKVAAHFGYGTWKEISGVFMLSRSSSYTVGSSGGSETHQHPLSSKGYAYIGIAWNTSDTSYIESKDFGLSTRYSGSRMANLPVYRTASDLSRATELGGATDAADSMPPYLVCHRWQRIA